MDKKGLDLMTRKKLTGDGLRGAFPGAGKMNAHPALPVPAWGERSEALPRGAWGFGGHNRGGGRLVGRASPPTQKPGLACGRAWDAGRTA
jgi:hypothetical protein